MVAAELAYKCSTPEQLLIGNCLKIIYDWPTTEGGRARGYDGSNESGQRGKTIDLQRRDYVRNAIGDCVVASELPGAGRTFSPWVTPA